MYLHLNGEMLFSCYHCFLWRRYADHMKDKLQNLHQLLQSQLTVHQRIACRSLLSPRLWHLVFQIEPYSPPCEQVHRNRGKHLQHQKYRVHIPDI